MTLTEFCQVHHITSVARTANSNPNMPGEWPQGATHYRVTLKRPGHHMTVPFSMGMAHTSPPTTENVLSCLLSDASITDNAQDFSDFCRELGFETDSRRAERTYKATVRQTAKLRTFLGEEYDQALYHVDQE